MGLSRFFVLAGIVLGLLGFVLVVRDQVGFGVRVAAALARVVPGSPSAVLGIDPDPRVSTIAYITRDGYELEADIYEPAGFDRSPAVVLVNGVEPEGKKYSPLVQLADGLSRAGFVVLVPDALDYANYRVLPQDIGALVRGFQILQGRNTVDMDRVGFVGFSMGGSLAMVAAADPEIVDEVQMVAAVGSYFSLEAIIQAVTTKTVRTPNGHEFYEPDDYVWLITRNTLLSQVRDADDRSELFRVFSLPSPQPNLEVMSTFDPQGLGEQARSVYVMLTNREPDSVRPLVSKVRELMPGVFESISPKYHLDRITASISLLHDRNDRYVPVQESDRTFTMVGGSPRARLEILDVVQHAELVAPDLSPPVLFGSYIPGMWKLFRFVFDSLDGLVESRQWPR
ncbi:MAG: hypothetical protein CL790_01585 [Chloroflexi bacterium]|nr:hypothetical protein [Chloroflexota bacterium]HCU72759.1 hypothetical protein [Chloroflexota bacterium]|tara:strand:+ start:16154 stop:17344 length:1191 start_codon:yes stop_codon:yes gene_type:complete